VQTLTSAFDKSISNARVFSMSEAFETAVEHSGFCAMPRALGHVYIIPIDGEAYAGGAEHWWLDRRSIQGGKTVLDMMVEFVSCGVLFPTEGTEEEDTALIGVSRCDVEKRGTGSGTGSD